MIKLTKIQISSTDRRITLIFDDKSVAKIWKFGKTTYSTVPESLLKSSLINLKNVCLRSFYFMPENSSYKQPTKFEIRDIKAHLKPFINTKFKTIYEPVQ